MKKFITLFVFVFILIGLTGCKGNGPNEITKDEIFNQEGKYLVYFSKDNCEDCKNTNSIIKEYLKEVNSGEYEKAKTIYKVNLSKEENASIFRTYDKVAVGLGDGQGDGTFFVDGVTSADKLYIGATASLILIATDSSGKKFATFVASGYEDITTYLQNQLTK